MTISSTVRIAGPYIGSGAATVFPFAFKVFAAAEMQVAKLNTTSNVETILVLNTDYTVTLNGDQNSNPGGTITTPAVLASGYNLTITSDIANLQPTDLTNQGGFYPEVITDALDRATIQIQQLDQNSRAIKIPLSDGVLDMTTPVVAQRQGKYLAFDSFGLPVVSSGTGSDSALRTDLANASAVSAGSRLSGFRQTGTGATARTVDTKLKDTVSVKDFGAVGDGVADDTAAIQAAINTNKEVFVPNGTYKITSSLTMTLNQQIRGESSELTKIKTTTGVNAITVADSAYCIISDLYFDGNSIGLVGIKVGLGVTFSAFHEIKNCKIYNFTSHGIHLNGTSYCLVKNCFIRLNGGNGIYNNLGSPSGYGNANTISDCQIWDNTTYGIQLYKAHNNIIQNTKFVLGTGGTSLTVGNRIANIYINNTHDTTIDKCEFENVDYGFTTYNIVIDDTDGAIAPNTINNKIRDCRFVGAALNCSYNVAIGLVGAVYSTEIVSTTFVRSVNEDVYLGSYANNTVIDDCIHRYTYDTPLSGENATVYNPFSLKYTLFEFGNQSRGTFTPIFQTTTGGTNWSSTYYATTTGFYTKIQNVVNFSLVVHVNAITTTGAGALIITGLPFECWDNGVPASLSISGLLALTIPLTYNVNVRARLRRATYVDRSISNSTVIELFYGAANDTPLPSAQINNGHYMALSGSYLTNVI